MPNVALCTAADVYRRAGGEAALSQLIDPEGTGTYSTDVLNLAIADATNFVVMAAGVQSQLAGYTQSEMAERFPELVTITALKAIPLCWDYGTSGRARPENIQQMDARADALLQQLAERRRKHGATDFSPSPAHRITQVDNDPDRNRLVLASWKAGWC